MTLESETLFVVGESDELVVWSGHSGALLVSITGLKDAIVDKWRSCMLNGGATSSVELVTNNVEGVTFTQLTLPSKKIQHLWLKFSDNHFLPLPKLDGVEINLDTHNRWIQVLLNFSCIPATFEQAVATALSQSVPEKQRKSFAAHRTELEKRLRAQLEKIRPIPDPNTVVGPVDAFTPSITYPPQTHITGPDGKLHSVSPVDFSHMRWEDGNQVVEFPKVKITKHEE